MPSASDFKQSLFKFTQNIIDASLVCTLLHNTTNLVVDWVRVRAVWRPQIKSDEVGGLALQQLSSLMGVAGRHVISVC